MKRYQSLIQSTQGAEGESVSVLITCTVGEKTRTVATLMTPTKMKSIEAYPSFKALYEQAKAEAEEFATTMNWKETRYEDTEADRMKQILAKAEVSAREWEPVKTFIQMMQVTDPTIKPGDSIPVIVLQKLKEVYGLRGL